MLLRMAATLVLIAFTACFSTALEVGFVLAGGHSAGSQDTGLPASAGVPTAPAAR